VGVPKLPRFELSRLWNAIILHANLLLKWGLKQICNPRWELSNDMSHAIFTHWILVDSWLLVVGSQIINLTSGLSFGHNLCFRCPNGQWKPILDISVPRAFQWYKKLLKPLSFDPCNHPLKIRDSMGTRFQLPKWYSLGVWRFIPSHFLTLLIVCCVTLDFSLGP